MGFGPLGDRPACPPFSSTIALEAYTRLVDRVAIQMNMLQT